MKHFLSILILVSAAAAGEITYQRLLEANSEPGNWLTYSGGYASHRHSKLDQVNTGNVSRLKMLWAHQMKITEKLETTPLAIDGVLYITRPPSDVIALDAVTGRPFWTYRRPMPDKLTACCGQVNRGVAAFGGRLYVGTIDAHLVALDARTGSVIWDVEVADYRAGYSVTVAPLVVKDKIVVGIAGGEYGIRGFLDAYDAKSGKRAWRFYTVPAPGEPGSETWKGDAWKTGGAPTWVTGSYDPKHNLIYWGTGNPSPDWNGDVRPGDNLYSCSVIALDADTGKRKWHFQFTPHDLHDWDAVQIPVLVDGMFRGQKREMMYWANRNGFFYVLDRVTGEFLRGAPFVRLTWASGLDDRGRPVRNPNTAPSREGALVYPGVQGGTNWYSPSYSPLTGLMYFSVWDYASIYYTGDAPYRPGNRFLGSVPAKIPEDPGTGAVRAIEPETGKLRWEYKLLSTPNAGILSTAGGVVFGGTNEGHFFALDAATGKELWRINTGGQVIAGPMTYLSGGKQRISIAAGSALFTFGLDE
ncbi:MAG: PQQ-dependent dehydrogenase, methanol/ethanol family [Bryobacteraceae bacterium]